MKKQNFHFWKLPGWVAKAPSPAKVVFSRGLGCCFRGQEEGIGTPSNVFPLGLLRVVPRNVRFIKSEHQSEVPSQELHHGTSHLSSKASVDKIQTSFASCVCLSLPHFYATPAISSPKTKQGAR